MSIAAQLRTRDEKKCFNPLQILAFSITVVLCSTLAVNVVFFMCMHSVLAYDEFRIPMWLQMYSYKSSTGIS